MLTCTRNIIPFIFSMLFALTLSAQQIEPSVVYTSQDGLPQIHTTTMLQDSRGYIWVGSKRGFARFNGAEWTHIESQMDVQFGELTELSDGNIFALVDAGGLHP